MFTRDTLSRHAVRPLDPRLRGLSRETEMRIFLFFDALTEFRERNPLPTPLRFATTDQLVEGACLRAVGLFHLPFTPDEIWAMGAELGFSRKEWEWLLRRPNEFRDLCQSYQRDHPEFEIPAFAAVAA